jgi:thiosulfate/3-mercaptopyruvate sulfurtransferase
LRKGHIPKSLNFPNALVLTAPQNITGVGNLQTFLPKHELEQIFAAKGINIKRRTISSCGSGVTASVNAFALFLVGNTNFSVYDGSWSEWGQENLSSECPIVMGE